MAEQAWIAEQVKQEFQKRLLEKQKEEETSNYTTALTVSLSLYGVLWVVAILTAIGMTISNKKKSTQGWWAGGIGVAMLFGPFYFIQLGVGLHEASGGESKYSKVIAD
jgi:hypothetical protein